MQFLIINFVTKTRVFASAHSGDFVILACTVLIGMQGVTDRLTDGGQTDTSTIAKTREASLHAAVHKS